MRTTWVALVAGGALLGWIGHGEADARSGATANASAGAASQALIPQFENAAVTVWKTILAPHQKLGMHRHEHGRVVVALKGGTLTIPQDDGGSRKLVLETGRAYWLDADPPGKLHGDDNQSGQPLEMMVIEMKDR
jgi:quercetin dioxygenase-like cupin family protein